MKVSVLMTVYNGGPYLSLAIESVLSQSFRDFEFVIVNDASKDDSLKTIHLYQDSRIKVITNAKNLGQTSSLNVGLRSSVGEYIARMDADDIAYPNWLKSQLEFLNNNLKCVVASTKAVTINSRGQMIKELNSPLEHREIILKSLISSPINHVGCLMRRSVIIDAGGYEEGYKIVADYALWSKLLSQNSLILTNPKVLVAVRTHDQSISMVEADRRVVPEMVKIITKNVSSLTASTVDEIEATLMWRVAFAGHEISLEQFLKGIALTQRIYTTFKSDFISQKKYLEVFLRKLMRTFFLKRIVGLARKGDLVQSRATVMVYVKTHGYFNIFLFLWFLTYFGRIFEFVWNMYSMFLLHKTSRKVIS